MSQWPTVSVVVPVYNSERTIQENIRSLLDLNYPRERLELILVNNASTDSTPRILERYADRIRIVNEPRRGRARARNAGTRAARHDVIAFIDADCAAHPDWIAALAPRVADPTVGVAGGKILAPRPCSAVEEFGESEHDHQRSIEYFRPAYAITPNWASRRDVLLEMNGFDETLVRCEDCDLSYRMLKAGRQIVYEPAAIVYQRNRPTRPALFREGFDNGFYSTRLLGKHAQYLKEFGHPRVNWGRYRALSAGAARILRGRATEKEKLEFIFTSGKVTGKICGSIRFGRIEL